MSDAAAETARTRSSLAEFRGFYDTAAVLAAMQGPRSA